MEPTDTQLLASLILDVKKDVSEMKKDLSDTRDMSYANSIVLDEHMRRSEAAESRLDVQEEKLDEFVKSMEPVKEHVKTVHILTSVAVKVMKGLALVGSLVGTVLGCLKFLR